MRDNNVGLVNSLISGAGFLIIVTIITLVIVSTLLGANLLRATATTTTATENNAWINATTYTLTGFSTANRNYAITSIVNASDGVTILTGNYSFSATTGVLSNATATTWSDVNVTYTYIAPTEYETSTNNMGTNFTAGIDNISGKIPTILLIAAVVLLFGVLVFLVAYARKMQLGGKASL